MKDQVCKGQSIFHPPFNSFMNYNVAFEFVVSYIIALCTRGIIRPQLAISVNNEA